MKYSTIILAAVAVLALSFGCLGGVSKGEYDSLKASCDTVKQDMQAQLTEQEAATKDAERQSELCGSEKRSLQVQLEDKQKVIDSVLPDSAAAAEARNVSGKIAQYQLALAYYNDAFGPGKIPNTPRMKKIEAQVASLSDPALSSAWNGVKNCAGSSECDAAKASFTGTISSKISGFEHEIALLFPAG